MYLGRSIAVVVPAYNEETQIDQVIASMPAEVDRIIVVDDCSSDQTVDRCEVWAAADPSRVELVRHRINQGVGAAILSGYQAALAEGLEVVVVMAGDGQMDPADLLLIAGPVAEGRVDYAKGNRLFTGQAWKQTPKVRYFGNACLSFLTKIASGYWHVADSQSGYTAVSARALGLIDLGSVYPRYGFPNDFLIHLNIQNCRVTDVPVPPRYGIGERSKMRVWKVIPAISWLLFKGFFYRMFQKYVIRDFHPLVFFYGLGSLMLVVGLALGMVEIYDRVRYGGIAVATVVLVALLAISGIQMILFAMWFDMEYNRDLR